MLASPAGSAQRDGSGERLQLQLLADSAPASVTCATPAARPLSLTSLVIDMPAVGAFDFSATTFLGVRTDGKAYRIEVLYLDVDGVHRVRLRCGSMVTDHGLYDPAQQRVLRLRRSSAGLVAESSPTGVDGSWSVFDTCTTGATELDAATVELGASKDPGGASVAYVDALEVCEP